MLHDEHIETSEILDEMKRSTPEAVESMRAHGRLSVRANVIVDPGNQSDRGSWRVQGVTGDVSAGGAQILTPAPLRIGDIYLISFDRSKIDVPPVFARCLRARLVREDAFEAGLKFLQPIELPTLAEGAGAKAIF